MKVKVLQPFNYKGKNLKKGDEVTLSADAAKLYTSIDHAELVEKEESPKATAPTQEPVVEVVAESKSADQPKAPVKSESAKKK